MRRNKEEHKQHHVEKEGDIGKLTAYTKKGKPIMAIFDAVDIDKINAFSNWRAVWHTDFDCQAIESKEFKDDRAVRTPVASAILQCSPNAPVRHINGDFFDNRRSNLEIYDVKGQPNDYKKGEAGISVILKDRYGRVVGEFLIDADDLDLVVNREHVWMKKRRGSGQPYVVDTNGLLLAHFLLGVCEGVVNYKNKNPLDNRRANIKLECED
jgi:hypothetical protein